MKSRHHDDGVESRRNVIEHQFEKYESLYLERVLLYN